MDAPITDKIKEVNDSFHVLIKHDYPPEDCEQVGVKIHELLKLRYVFLNLSIPLNRKISQEIIIEHENYYKELFEDGYHLSKKGEGLYVLLLELGERKYKKSMQNEQSKLETLIEAEDDVLRKVVYDHAEQVKQFFILSPKDSKVILFYPSDVVMTQVIKDLT